MTSDPVTSNSGPRSAAPLVDTPRLRLRAWVDADRAPWHALHADPEVTRYLGPGPYDRIATDEMIDRFEQEWADRRLGLWAVEARRPVPGWSSRLLGFVGLHAVPDDLPFAPAVEVGWRLARPAWGHGYATEGASAAVADGFQRCRLAEIVSFTVPANLRSRAVMERIGMVRDPAGDFDHPRLPSSSPLRRHVLYRLRAPGSAKPDSSSAR